MKNNFFLILTTIIFSLIFYVFYKGLQNPNIYKPNIETGKKIPNFEAKIFGTDTIISSDEIFKNKKYYLVNIWASWCAPCRVEHPLLMELTSQEDLEIIGINYKDNILNAKKFLKELNNPYNIIISDKNGILGIEWGAYGVPETFLIYNNRIIKKIIGPLNESFIIEINELIK